MTSTPPAGLVRPGGPVWFVSHTGKAPEVDGWLDDWGGDSVPVANFGPATSRWGSGADLSARVLMAWDETYLYIGASITDDSVYVAATAAGPGTGDALEVLIDVDFADGWEASAPGPMDLHLELTAPHAGGGVEARVWRPAAFDPKGVRVAGHRVESGYIVEAALAWAALGITPADTDRVGLALTVIDVDGPDQGEATLMSSVPHLRPNDPRTYGTLILRP